MKTKILVIPPQLLEKKDTNVDFLFPLKGYCVGFLHEYELKDIPKDHYIYVNRLLNTDEIASLGKILETNSFKGIVFEDLGILQYIKEKNLSLETILYATHAVCSLETANTYLEDCTSVVISLDITKEEVFHILNHTDQKASVYLYGPMPYLYSRRTLLTNYADHFKVSHQTQRILQPLPQGNPFRAIENEWGTVLFDSLPFNGHEYLECPNICYAIVNLDWQETIDWPLWWHQFKENELTEATTTGFLNRKTIYRLPPKGSAL